MNSSRKQISTILVLAPWILHLAGAAPVAAEPASPPWHAGVSAEARERALGHFIAGNKDLEEGLFHDAIADYRLAITHWRHPAIYANLAIALTQVGEIHEAYAMLDEATRHGPAGLSPAVYDNLRRYELRLRRQLAIVVVECRDDAVEVKLDGKTLEDCERGTPMLVEPGAHELSARQSERRSVNRELNLLPGTRTVVDLQLEPERPMPTWLPPAVLGTGVAFIAMGGLRHKKAADGLLNPELENDVGDVRHHNRLAIGLYIAGATVTAAGTALWLLNRPRETLVRRAQDRRNLSITPMVSIDGKAASLSVSGSFR